MKASGSRGQSTADRDRTGRDRLLALIARFPSRRVAVVGDFIADEFIYGRVARV
jgi:hypothetical protein